MENQTNLLKKLSAIMASANYIQKDKKNAFHNYNYASEKAIKERLHGLLVEHGVMFIVNRAIVVNRTDYTSDKGKRSSLTDVEVGYRFMDCDTGEFIEGAFTGTGDDSADKGTYKAITGAIKYILTSVFLIPTGDDPENDEAKPGKSDQQSNGKTPPPADPFGPDRGPSATPESKPAPCAATPKSEQWVELENIMRTLPGATEKKKQLTRDDFGKMNEVQAEKKLAELRMKAGITTDPNEKLRTDLAAVKAGLERMYSDLAHKDCSALIHKLSNGWVENWNELEAAAPAEVVARVLDGLGSYGH